MTQYDVTIVGGGHNGLVAAAYLARAGLRTLLLERLPHTGGAAVSTRAFDGVDARLSRYSYLVSLLPEQISADLDLDLQLRSRPVASYTPTWRDGRPMGLLVERDEGTATADSFRELTGGDEEYAAWRAFYAEMQEAAQFLAPDLDRAAETRARRREAARLHLVVAGGAAAGDRAGAALRRRHGAWRRRDRRPDRHLRLAVRPQRPAEPLLPLPLDRQRHRRVAGARRRHGCGDRRAASGGHGGRGRRTDRRGCHCGRGRRRGGCRRPTRQPAQSTASTPASCSAAWRRRCSTCWWAGRATHLARRGRSSSSTCWCDGCRGGGLGSTRGMAFAGTVHVAEDFSQLEAAYDAAASGQLPDPLPGELYCHTLTDPSILGRTCAAQGYQTLTYFGVHTAAGLFAENGATREQAVDRALDALDAHLEEPIRDCLASDAAGRPCLEVKTPQDIEAALNMPGGHIFHGDLQWPWLTAECAAETPAERWGVATGIANVLVCGSGARRGGAVSGIGGHNAAMAALETLGA
ncbi:MAG: NAD(P)-binding protein [Nocardioidaceae bacterium]